MTIIIFLFWLCIFFVVYTYIGYGLLLCILIQIKKFAIHCQNKELVAWPDVTLVICAYNEEDIIEEKMNNCLKLEYPGKINIMWVTDGSDDSSNKLLSRYTGIEILYNPERRGKSAALNHAAKKIRTGYAIFSDANTMLNSSAIYNIMRCFLNDDKVGCVAGEKKIISKEKNNAAGGGEGIYWKYESLLKAWDYKLYSAMGAAGELFAIRTGLWEDIEEDTLLDDFILSMRLVGKGYKIAYCKEAYAIEGGSLNMEEEAKRKVRICAGGLQSIWRLRSLLNPLKYPVVSFQYISHRVLRWSVAPICLFLLIPLNTLLVFMHAGIVYKIAWSLQIAFYLAALLGYYFQERNIKVKALFVPFYFLFMNVNVIKGIRYLWERNRNGNKSGAWEKSKRA